MEIALDYTLSVEFKETSKYGDVNKLKTCLKNYFYSKSYGESIHKIFISLMSVHPKYDPFFKVKRPHYVEDKFVKGQLTEIHLYKQLFVDIKLDFNNFINSTQEEGLRMVANEFLETFRVLKYPKKIKDFDSKAFLADLELFFKEEKIL